jgi:serine protease AprX
MAGIIAGSDAGFSGVAPGARIVNVKVADRDGDTELSRVLAGIEWVVRHRRDGGRNIRVLNLSFGADALEPYQVDPLAAAVEAAWHQGVFVVAAAGNGGQESASLDSPAIDPFVLAVGASDPNGTAATDDDAVASFTSRGAVERGVDLLAPGKSVVSLRVPGSTIDREHPEGRLGDRWFRGSGSSQAAAVTSGLAALLIEQRPDVTPDELKALLLDTATPLKGDEQAQGAGLANAALAADTATTGGITQPWERAAGGEDLTLEPGWWTSNRWTSNRWTSNRWTSNRWTSNRWTSNRWTSNRWT